MNDGFDLDASGELDEAAQQRCGAAAFRVFGETGAEAQ